MIPFLCFTSRQGFLSCTLVNAVIKFVELSLGDGSKNIDGGIYLGAKLEVQYSKYITIKSVFATNPAQKADAAS